MDDGNSVAVVAVVLLRASPSTGAGLEPEVLFVIIAVVGVEESVCCGIDDKELDEFPVVVCVETAA